MYFFVFLILAGFFALAAVCAGIEYSTFLQHVGASIAVGIVGILAMSSVTLLKIDNSTYLGMGMWLVLSLLAFWFAAYIMCRIIYSADSRQGQTMAHIVTGGYALFAIFRFALFAQ